jgi:hypothetical protein
VLLGADLGLDGREVAVPRLVVHRGDQVGREVDDLLEVLGRQVEQVAQARRDALEEPDVGDRSGQLDVAHPLTADLGPGHLDAAALADDALEPDPLVLAAVALPVPGGTEDLLAEEAILLRTQRPVVDGLGLLHLTVRPLADVVAGGKADAQLIEEVDVEQRDDPFPGLVLLLCQRLEGRPAPSAQGRPATTIRRLPPRRARGG